MRSHTRRNAVSKKRNGPIIDCRDKHIHLYFCLIKDQRCAHDISLNFNFSLIISKIIFQYIYVFYENCLREKSTPDNYCSNECLSRLGVQKIRSKCMGRYGWIQSWDYSSRSWSQHILEWVLHQQIRIRTCHNMGVSKKPSWCRVV